jgi:Forkhead domain
VQIGEIKFNFLLPHQTKAQQESVQQLEEETSSDLGSLTSLSATPTPPPDTSTAPPEEPTPEKPDIPYATLIAQSLLSHPRRRRTLQEIYAWIQDHHAYYKKQNKSWQSSIRHNLMSSPAFVLYGPRPGEVDSSDNKKSKQGKDEWGISPEYEGLIGDLSAKEGDTDKLSTKLNKKKPAAAQTPKTLKPPKTPKPPPPPPPPVEVTSPAPPHPEDKSKLEQLVKNIQGKGVDMGALLQQALAQMNKRTGKPLTTSPASAQPAPKRQKIVHPMMSNVFTSSGASAATQSAIRQPLPYKPPAAPIPAPAGAAQVELEQTSTMTGSTSASPSTMNISPAPGTTQVKLEPGEEPRGTKRPLEKE